MKRTSLPLLGWMALRQLGAKMPVGQKPPANREPSMNEITISDEMRLAVEALWPELVYKLPPKKDCLMGVPEGCGAIGNSLRRERQMEIYALYRDRKQLCTFFGPRRTSGGGPCLSTWGNNPGSDREWFLIEDSAR